jgi:hypothetical protein
MLRGLWESAVECAYHRPYFQHGGGRPRLDACGTVFPVLFWLSGAPLRRRIEGDEQQVLSVTGRAGLYNREQRSARQQQEVSIGGWAGRMRG